MIRKAELSDVPRIAEIRVFGWRNAYRGIVSDDILFCEKLVSTDIPRFESLIQSTDSESYVFDDGIIKASMTIGACRDEDKPDTLELWAIYVEPLMKGQGIGSILVDYCEALAIERGYKEICLWVLEQNDSSRRFYEKMGFVVDGTSKFLEHVEVMEVRYTKEL